MLNINSNIVFRCICDNPSYFKEIPVNGYFIFKYEKDGNPFFKYTPVLQKISDNEYKWAGKDLFNDIRKIYKTPNIRGYSYANSPVYNCTWDHIKSEWLVTH